MNSCDAAAAESILEKSWSPGVQIVGMDSKFQTVVSVCQHPAVWKQRNVAWVACRPIIPFQRWPPAVSKRGKDPCCPTLGGRCWRARRVLLVPETWTMPAPVAKILRRPQESGGAPPPAAHLRMAAT